MTTTAPSVPPFGRALCAMVTPFSDDGPLDLDGAQRLADRLVAEGCDGLVLSGTTGESPTTSDSEKAALVRPSRGGRRPGSIVAGVGTFDTRHTLEMALRPKRRARTPCWWSALLQQASAGRRSRRISWRSPTRRAPVALYDIPGRTGTRIEPDTILRLAEHPRIVAVKDCSHDFLAAQKVLARTDLAYYAGCDEHNLALYAVGGAGYISTVANIV